MGSKKNGEFHEVSLQTPFTFLVSKSSILCDDFFMQFNFLQNEFLKVQVSSIGAELRSIENLQTGYEYLWQADDKWWGRSAPVLFPRIGYEPSSCETKHGYARDSEFDLILESNTKLTYQLHEELQITYELQGPKIVTTYNVLTELPFMIGAHPAFNIEALPTQVLLPNSKYYKLRDGRIDYTNIFESNSQFLTINDQTFVDDALVFINDFVGHSAQLSNTIEIEYESELLGVWSPPGAPFVCLEPWWVNVGEQRSFQFTISCL
ncbi:aldose 1-epimerase domain protein [Bacteriovorax sp. Seq25_V]|nr:aldose 1-epimerase domain protein [Bacteriovorax sp. Seq25_V]